MQLVTFSRQGQSRLGARLLRDGHGYVVDLHAANSDLPREMVAFLSLGEMAQQVARHVVESAPEQALLPENTIKLLPPVPYLGKLICLGYNYFNHLEAGRKELPTYPTFFCKTLNTIIASGDPIVLPRASQQVDFEAELAVVIGQRARYVSAEQAPKYVAGYSILNDVSARDYQNRTSQWMIGKSFDTFGPFGPSLVTADEIPNPQELELSLTVNGVEQQHSNTRHMIFSVSTVIAYLSEVMTLEPGDVISTGTPSRIHHTPGTVRFLQPGDIIKIRVEKIGELVNPVVAEA